jgi:uncharacterized protein YajQ (UPF0234 family)
MNPYIAFSMEQRKKMVKADPSRHSNIGGLAKEIGAMWRELSDAEKAKYGSGSHKITKMGKTKKAKVTSKVKAEVKKGTRKAKKALSPYIKFYKDNYAKIKKENPSMTLPEIAKKIGKMWSEK